MSIEDVCVFLVFQFGFGAWSWWRVMLAFLAFLGHNPVYLLAGFLCFCSLKT